MSNEPIAIKSPLFDTPNGDPEFASVVALNDGAELQVADPRATRAMLALMDMQAVMGGAASHWGGPAAFAELMSATHGLMFASAQEKLRPWHRLFNFVNDAGHCENGLYALKANYKCAGLDVNKLKGFRSIESQLSGHGEAHLFPEGVLISNGPLGSGLPQAQGLCAADHLAKNDRITVVAISDGACMEGEAKEALTAIPGMAKKSLLNGFVLMVSDNNTKLSGRIDEESFSMEPTFQSLEILGWKVIRLERGNDLQCCVSAVEEALEWAQMNPAQPVVIHARTVKGYGVRKTEESASGGHGFPLKSPKGLDDFLGEIYGGEGIPDVFATGPKI